MNQTEAGDSVLYKHPAGVVVTTRRAIVPGRTYAIANLASVALRITPAPTGFANLMALLATCVLLLFGLSLGLSSFWAGSQDLSTAEQVGVVFSSTAPYLVLFAFLLLGWLSYRSRTATYTVFFNSRAMETTALVTKDEVLARGLETAIHRAMEAR